MNQFTTVLEMEWQRNKQQLEEGQSILDGSPEGFLTIRPRAYSETCYWNVNQGQGRRKERRQVNINHNTKLVNQLFEKKYQQEVVQRAGRNMEALQQLMKEYQSTDSDEIVKVLGPQYQKVFTERRQKLIEMRMTARYSKFPYNPKFHTHETDYGELVRSKSEQIIANSLFSYGIPFHYEEEFLYQVGDIGRVYPDFTLLFPNGRWKIWEHLGLLDDIAYCDRFAEKLNLYQMNGLVIGKDLIFTMDDASGNLSSGIIQQVIHTHILPELGDVRVDADLIIRGMRGK